MHNGRHVVRTDGVKPIAIGQIGIWMSGKFGDEAGEGAKPADQLKEVA